LAYPQTFPFYIASWTGSPEGEPISPHSCASGLVLTGPAEVHRLNASTDGKPQLVLVIVNL